MKKFLSKNIKNALKLASFKPIKQKLIIKIEGIPLLLRKIYIIVPEELKHLVSKKNYILIYYPIKNINISNNKSFILQTKESKYRICLNKEQIIDEVKSFLEIENKSTSFKFYIYDQALNLINSDFQLTKSFKNINDFIKNNVIYIKIIKNDKEEVSKRRKKFILNHNALSMVLKNEEQKKEEDRTIVKTIKVNNLKNIFSAKNLRFKDIEITKEKEKEKERIKSIRKYNNFLSCSPSFIKQKIFLLSSDSCNRNITKINKVTMTDNLGSNTNSKSNNTNSNKYNQFLSFKSNAYNIIYNMKKNNKNERINNNSSNLSSYDYFTESKSNNKISSIINRDKKKAIKVTKKPNHFFNNKYINNIIMNNNLDNYNSNVKQLIRSFSDNFLSNNLAHKNENKPTIFSSKNICINILEPNCNRNKIYDNYFNSDIKKNTFKNNKKIHDEYYLKRNVLELLKLSPDKKITLDKKTMTSFN